MWRFLPFTFFSRVEASLDCHLCGLGALAIYDAQGGRRTATLCCARKRPKSVEHRIQHTRLLPAVIVVRDQLPFRQVVRHVAPLAACAQKIQNRIDDFAALVGRWREVGMRIGLGDQVIDQAPLFIR